ncbi:helix-turn-helix domain-containing protein [Lachnospiraceae bacterium LCP25S3_G4]
MTTEKKYEMGNRIRECRKLNKMSQTELAEAIAVSDNTISNMETGSNNVKLENIKKVADLFDVSLDYLVKGNGPTPITDIFVKRYLNLTEEDKLKMISVMNIFFPEVI